MGNELSLLERIAAGTPANHNIKMNDSESVASILNHVKRILNVRQGSVETMPDYGLPDFNDLARRFPNAIEEIKRSIRECLEQYEPRLINIHVDHVQDGEHMMDLRYDVKAQISLDGKNTSVWFETILDTAGKVSIRG
jgi:type VI secretion system protein